MRNIYPLNSRFTLPFLFVLVISLLFMLPGGILQAQTSDDNFEYVENGTRPVATFTAMDPEQTAIVSWTLDGTDAGDFDIDGGVLTFKESPNHEDPADADDDNIYALTVQATDSTMRMGTKDITVTVTNVNELGTVTLSALRPQSATAFTATLTDLDNPNPTTITGVTWQWAKASSRNGTYIDIDEGATLAEYSPKDEDVNSYLRATASYTDGEGSGKSAMARSEYAVQAVRGNNEPPKFPDQDPSTVAIDDTAMRMVPENTPAGMAIGNPVAATDSNNDVLTYTLDDTGADSFDINRATGQLMTKAALDFEDEVTYRVTVRATDPKGIPQEETAQTANSAEIVVVITVTDINEAPMVTGEAAVTFQEEAGIIASPLGDYSADDPETGQSNDDNGVTWSVTGADAGKFNIGNQDGGTPSELTFKAKPDFEAQGDANGDNVYEVTVTATDDTSNRGTLAVKVTVANENEDGEVTLSRTQPRVGIPVRATLTDPDGSISGLTWQWHSGENAIAEAMSDTYIPTEADFINTVTLRVVASYTDGQGTEKSAVGTAGEEVAEDTRNRAPMFNDQDLDTEGIQNESATRMVEENAEAMDVVGRPVTANDPDPNTDALIYTLSGADAGLFTVDQDDSTSQDADEGGQIRVGANTRLDYETRNGYMVTVTAEDSFGATASIPVTIRVTDVNEDPDVTGAATVEYPENGTGRVAVYTAVDQEETAIVSWTLDGTDADDFNIDGGVLTFKESPNSEMAVDDNTDNVYEVTVEATDATNRVGMKEVMVTVTNVNELGTVTLLALRPQSATAFTATLTDLDSVMTANPTGAITSGVTWQWAKASSRNGTYRDIEDGVSDTYSPADADVGSYLRATASYTDGEGPDKSAMARSEYAVQAVRGNNQAPAFPDQDPDETGVQNETTMRMVPENTPAGMAIGNPVAATDSNNDVLTYTLDDTGADSFDINRATGQLMTKAALDVETKSTYTVTVRATDPSGVPQVQTADDDNSAEIMVTITVTNLNEAPTITTGDDSEYEENATDTVATYTATDPERVTSIAWSLMGADAGKFNIGNQDEGTPGQLTFKAAPDFEVQGDANSDNAYEVTIAATDSDGNRSTSDVSITVNNVEELGMVTLSRTQPRVGVPVRATLTDPDGNISSLAWQWRNNGTAIEGATSDTYIPTEADFTNTVILRVVASYTDGHDTGKSAAGTAANPVAEDTRNRAPVFMDQDLETDVIENESATRMVEENTEAIASDDALANDRDATADNVGGAVTAEDPDPNEDPLIYTLSGADAGLFRVRSNGQIEVGAGTVLDYETRNSYMVTLTAEDSFGATASIPVTIRVTDLDEMPIITARPMEALGISGRNSASYVENGTAPVATYMATAPNAALVRWTLEGDDANDFTISIGGVFAFRNSPDYEMPADTNTDNVYMVRVRATSGSETAIHDVTITVTDEVLSISGRNDIEYVENLTDSVETYAVAGSMVTWSLEGDDADDFTISGGGVLAFRNSPDYEMPADTNTDNVYMITVKASGGEETAALDVEVTVTDEALVISGLVDIDYEEDGTDSVGTFVADGPNAASATWSLEGADADDFAISSGGELTFVSSPDYEMPADADADNVYMVTVKATSGMEMDTLDVEVTVTDVMLLSISGRNDIEYAENLTDSVGTFVADGPNAASATWSLEGADADDFAISSAGVLVFVSSPDYEMPADADEDNVYMITVKATSGTEMATRDVEVTVTDEVLSISGRNDIEYAENLTDSVETYTASGPAITWSLEGADADDFAISSAGVLAFVSSPDYEMPADADEDNVYMITVRARSGSEMDTLDVEVTVTDEALVISGLVDIDYEENGADSVGTFVAEGPNAASATWSLEGADAGDFAISSGGELTFVSSPDYEMPADADADNGYMITVKATSGMEMDTLDVSITVTDADDPSLLEIHDTNNNGRIDRDEVIAAIRVYLRTGDITRDEVLELIRLYLRG